jgi:large-conductance mechanosensitive channel
MRGVSPEEAVKTDEARLLEEIRDLLRQQRA